MLCRAGHYEEAIDQLKQAIQHSEANERALGWLLMTIAQQHLGEIDQARSSFDKARQWIESQQMNKLRWQARAELEILSAEVEALLAEAGR